MADEATGVPIRLRSGDCVVEIRYVGRGATTSVMVTDPRTGDHSILDATELESLARGPAAEVRELLNGIGGEAGSPP